MSVGSDKLYDWASRIEDVADDTKDAAECVPPGSYGNERCSECEAEERR